MCEEKVLHDIQEYTRIYKNNLIIRAWAYFVVRCMYDCVQRKGIIAYSHRMNAGNGKSVCSIVINAGNGSETHPNNVVCRCADGLAMIRNVQTNEVVYKVSPRVCFPTVCETMSPERRVVESAFQLFVI